MIESIGSIELKALTPDDWAVWRELRLTALAEAPDAFGSRLADWQGDGDREERWRARLGIPGSYNVVAVVDGKGAGMAGGVRGPCDCVVELISMWVSAAARGRGVADRLVLAVEEWGLRAGAGVLRLDVVPGNARAIAFYRRRGFVEVGAAQGELVMEKVLRSR
ncbi:GNAT family N-acetyltransferase [Streptomyces sp. ME19-01-6]|uniref:GNAT family N-acetyltransferase n=1 Tax=Streptomyces sp. ME19-01-6 TaxID=3028686 RepID=UPI0029B8D68A|nr:GNAT family N-acetyltransferase [Streptomyces sp. ME19-01-6]MDX3225934.1 GNAT family N-acetyltransferase [Streptomyces sp. ME19-01-6]